MCSGLVGTPAWSGSSADGHCLQWHNGQENRLSSQTTWILSSALTFNWVCDLEWIAICIECMFHIPLSQIVSEMKLFHWYKMLSNMYPVDNNAFSKG